MWRFLQGVQPPEKKRKESQYKDGRCQPHSSFIVGTDKFKLENIKAHLAKSVEKYNIQAILIITIFIIIID